MSKKNDNIYQYVLPDLGEGIVECELVEWLVHENDTVIEDQPVCEVMTDKALMEIPSQYNGIIKKLYYVKGDIAPVGSVLFDIEKTAESYNNADEEEIPLEMQNEAIDKEETLPDFIDAPKVLTSPSVRREAKKHNVPLHKVVGSGKNGRIYYEDVMQYLNQMGSIDDISKQTEKIENSINNLNSQENQVINDVKRILGIQANMSKKMSESKKHIPHFTLVEEINLSLLMQIYSNLKAQHNNDNFKLSMTCFFIKSLSLALLEYPILNSQVNEDVSEVIYLKHHHIGVAMDTDNGLIVPNIKHVENLSITDIAKQLMLLVQHAKNKTLSVDAFQGGTFSLSNIGTIAGTVATPIIHYPETAIVAIGRVKKVPMFDDHNNVVEQNIAHFSCSADHRIIDGATVAKFLKYWKMLLENPALMLLHLK